MPKVSSKPEEKAAPPSVPIQLLDIGGSLHTPLSACVDEVNRQMFTEDPMIIVSYDAGDCDSINWPNPNLENLARALYGDRECGIIPDHPVVLLPDGTEFNIDDHAK